MEKWIFAIIFLGIAPLYLQEQKIGCNEALCASIVSKCMLTQSCKCNTRTNATCSRECSLCLDYLYTECCQCVDLCPKQNLTDTTLGQKSHVEEFPESEPALFQALTEERDRLLRWVSYTFATRVTILNPVENKEINVTTVSTNEYGLPIEETINCTVAFLSQCMAFGKCRDSCLSMGASSYRWFHDGCCECVGSTCLNYGMNEGRCLECPKEIDDDDDDDDGDEDDSDDGNKDTFVIYNDDTGKAPEAKEEKETDLLHKDDDDEVKDETLQKVDS